MTRIIDEAAEYFHHGGFKLAFWQGGKASGEPVLLIHGFASSSRRNWVETGWFELLAQAGFRVIAMDNRGFGLSDKSHVSSDYRPELMAADSAALLEHLNIGKAHIFGYSMGARLSFYLALRRPELVHSAVLGGLGLNMLEGKGDWQTISEALLAPSIDDAKTERARAFRQFAEGQPNDLKALAACILNFAQVLSEDEIKTVKMPALVAVGGDDDHSGSPEPLAELLPQGEALAVPGRDHFRALTDKRYEEGVLRFLAAHKM